ncbi:FKBP-type peptidyl-prolyl cis-trans isomerase protein [Rutstroemia sp. NJR-2017a WRK4]|nr:FKBP-type peptidyl-prolyl cis-trans isomerase protein [Rutstroemia sp. NJR-2017a WRK4]PQE11789.1 FKBP-type peptidyl-prolyl cis-trans isomerase protein [Rutstroemia sp. NJR-2017a WRK4]PQE13994.1 FKBP-type peptidyl-prolyl cis-trans isomerase protein [Rutstroemia sp. NJR-2017a BBW]
MRFSTLALLAFTSSVLAAEVKVEVTKAVECDRKTKKGDTISVHYRGNLEEDGKVGKEFDASYNRGQPLSFEVGKGRVIKGWDDNLIDMCIGEKRTLTIPPEFGYGDRAMGPIPAGSTLIFETELMGIQGVPQPESIVEQAPVVGEASESVKSAADKVSDTATGGVKSAISEAAEAVKTVIADTDGGGQEHNEL